VAQPAKPYTRVDLVLDCVNNAIASHDVKGSGGTLELTCHGDAARALFGDQAYRAGDSRETEEVWAGKSINRTLSKDGSQHCWHDVQFPDGRESDMFLCTLALNLDQYLNH